MVASLVGRRRRRGLALHARPGRERDARPHPRARLRGGRRAPALRPRVHLRRPGPHGQCEPRGLPPVAPAARLRRDEGAPLLQPVAAAPRRLGLPAPVPGGLQRRRAAVGLRRDARVRRPPQVPGDGEAHRRGGAQRQGDLGDPLPAGPAHVAPVFGRRRGVPRVDPRQGAGRRKPGGVGPRDALVPQRPRRDLRRHLRPGPRPRARERDAPEPPRRRARGDPGLPRRRRRADAAPRHERLQGGPLRRQLRGLLQRHVQGPPRDARALAALLRPMQRGPRGLPRHPAGHALRRQAQSGNET